MKFIKIKLKRYLLILLLLPACQKQQSFGGLPDLSVPLGAPASSPAPAPQEAKVAEEPDASIAEPPDPVAFRVKEQAVLTLRFDRGEVELLSASAKHHTVAQLTPRRLGRFAVEFWIGQELLERIRFNFPLLGAQDADKQLESGLTTTITFEVPVVERATHARIVDRETQKEWPLSLPLVSEEVAEPLP